MATLDEAMKAFQRVRNDLRWIDEAPTLEDMSRRVTSAVYTANILDERLRTGE